LKAGVLMAACDLVEITIRGRGAHGARPHQSRDPIAAAFALGQALYALCPRAVDSRLPSVLSICQIHGGSSNNVIPVEAKLGGTLRTLNGDARIELMQRIRSTCEAIGHATETEIEVEFSGSVPQLQNDPKLMEIANTAARRAVGEQHLAAIDLPSMGAEDFAFYLDHIPGALIRVGSASDEVGAPPLHTPEFDVDDRGLIAAMRAFVHLALEWSHSRHIHD
ncbi:MAG TPA: amidohydrolase, partial [Pirellulaceae bacterium]|nr:amidohydrolase [Pirellulaceae bacterium]